MTRLNFIMFVDSGSQDEPSPRRFASIQAAVKACNEYDEELQRFVWIQEVRPDATITHCKDGVTVRGSWDL